MLNSKKVMCENDFNNNNNELYIDPQMAALALKDDDINIQDYLDFDDSDVEYISGESSSDSDNDNLTSTPTLSEQATVVAKHTILVLVLSANNSYRSSKAQKNTHYNLDESSTLTIGRGRDCDIRYKDPMISEHHAIIHRSVIHDTNSTNGTFVNNRLIKKHTLSVGDTITCGATIIGRIQRKVVTPTTDENMSPVSDAEEWKPPVFLNNGTDKTPTFKRNIRRPLPMRPITLQQSNNSEGNVQHHMKNQSTNNENRKNNNNFEQLDNLMMAPFMLNPKKVPSYRSKRPTIMTLFNLSSSKMYNNLEKPSNPKISPNDSTPAANELDITPAAKPKKLVNSKSAQSFAELSKSNKVYPSTKLSIAPELLKSSTSCQNFSLINAPEDLTPLPIGPVALSEIDTPVNESPSGRLTPLRYVDDDFAEVDEKALNNEFPSTPINSMSPILKNECTTPIRSTTPVRSTSHNSKMTKSVNVTDELSFEIKELKSLIKNFRKKGRYRPNSNANK